MTNSGGPTRRTCGRWSSWAVAAWLVVGATAAVAEQARGPEIVAVRIGFDGRYKLGRWTALEIAVRGGDRPTLGYLSVVVPDGDDTPSRYATPANRPLQVVPGQTTRNVLYIKPGRELDELTVRFTPLEGDPVEATFESNATRGPGTLAWALDERQKLYVVVGPPIGLAWPQGAKLDEQVVLADTSQLPTRWYGYDAVDVLVFSTSQAETFRQLREDSAQLSALEDWLKLGGRLVLAVGAEARSVLDANSPLASFAPGKLADVETLKRGDALEKFVGAKQRIPFTGRGESQGLLAARLEHPQGVVLVEEGDLPLVVCTPRGFGQITFVAFDLDRRPIADWKLRGDLARQLLAPKAKASPATNRPGPAHSFTIGYSDLSGQLRGALDQFRGVRIVPFWVVGTLIFGYILLVGPIDYLVVRRVFKRMELTWITFPAIVLVVSVGAYGAARWTKGSQLRINQVDLVDVDAASGLVRGTSWSNIFSPVAASYDLSLQPARLGGEQVSAPQPLFSWLGQPGTAWNAMQAPRGGPRLFARAYQVSSQLDALLGVPIDVWSTKAFVGRWTDRRPESIEAALVETERNALEGTLASRLPCPLKDVLVAYDRWAYQWDRLEPGQTLKIEPRNERDLQTVLKSFHAVKNKQNDTYVYQGQPFDQSSHDIPGIVRQMMFYQEAGAEGYTHMSNEYQQFVDTSDHLTLRQAILVGQVVDDNYRASQLLRSGQPLAGAHDYWAFYRVLLPVKQEE
jgi:hypothetical protein